MIGIYKYTNKYDRKVYIGKSKDIELRYKQHLKTVKIIKIQKHSHFYKALRKYGIDAFDFEVLIECPIENLNYWEKFYIKYYCSNNSDYGYNMTNGGDGIDYWNDELKERQSKTLKGKKGNRLGAKFTEEQRINLSISHINYYKEHPEAREQLSRKLKQRFIDNPELRKNYCSTLGKHRIYREDGSYYMSF